jgi:hypothetical protein
VRGCRLKLFHDVSLGRGLLRSSTQETRSFDVVLTQIGARLDIFRIKLDRLLECDMCLFRQPDCGEPTGMLCLFAVRATEPKLIEAAAGIQTRCALALGNCRVPPFFSVMHAAQQVVLFGI